MFSIGIVAFIYLLYVINQLFFNVRKNDCIKYINNDIDKYHILNEIHKELLQKFHIKENIKQINIEILQKVDRIEPFQSITKDIIPILKDIIEEINDDKSINCFIPSYLYIDLVQSDEQLDIHKLFDINGLDPSDNEYLQ